MNSKTAVRVLMACGFVAILGLWPALQYQNARMVRKQKDTLIALRAFSFALANYHQELGTYPPSPETPIENLLQALEPFADHLDPRHQSSFKATDAWGHPIYFVATADRFAIWSLGADGKPDRSRPGGRQEGINVDLIWTESELWQWPSGLSGPSRPIHSENPIEELRTHWRSRESEDRS